MKVYDLKIGKIKREFSNFRIYENAGHKVHGMKKAVLL